MFTHTPTTSFLVLNPVTQGSYGPTTPASPSIFLSLSPVQSGPGPDLKEYKLKDDDDVDVIEQSDENETDIENENTPFTSSASTDSTTTDKYSPVVNTPTHTFLTLSPAIQAPPAAVVGLGHRQRADSASSMESIASRVSGFSVSPTGGRFLYLGY